MAKLSFILKKLQQRLAPLGRLLRGAWKQSAPVARTGSASLVGGTERAVPIEAVRCFDNFYDLESDGTTSWRWTGPGTAFTCFIDTDRQQPWRVVLEAIDSPSTVNWGNTFMDAEGTMALCRYDYQNGRHLLSADLPARPNAKGAVLRYIVQDARPPETGDMRPLGLRVAQFRLLSA